MPNLPITTWKTRRNNLRLLFLLALLLLPFSQTTVAEPSESAETNINERINDFFSSASTFQVLPSSIMVHSEPNSYSTPIRFLQRGVTIEKTGPIENQKWIPIAPSGYIDMYFVNPLYPLSEDTESSAGCFPY